MISSLTAVLNCKRSLHEEQPENIVNVDICITYNPESHLFQVVFTWYSFAEGKDTVTLYTTTEELKQFLNFIKMGETLLDKKAPMENCFRYNFSSTVHSVFSWYFSATRNSDFRFRVIYNGKMLEIPSEEMVFFAALLEKYLQLT